MRFLRWHEANPELFQAERETLEKRGFSLELDVLERHGIVEFIGNLTIGAKEYSLRIRYPYGYPDFPPEAYYPDFKEGRHQEPSSGKLCLLEEWKDSGYVYAEEILDRVVQWFEKQNNGFDPNEEIDSPEPKQYYINSVNRGIIFMPTNVFSDWSTKEGTFKMRLGAVSTKGNGQADLATGLLTEMHSYPNTWKADDRYGHLTQFHPIYNGIWFNVDEAPPYFKSQKEIINWLESKGHINAFKKSDKIANHQHNPNSWIGPLLGIRYPDEVGRRGNIQFRFLAISLQKFVSRQKQKPYQTKYVVFESKEISEEKMFSRIANLNPLREKHAIVVGLGTIGSSLALELSKAGVSKFTIVDPEFVDTGNVIRSVYTLHQVGFVKVDALKQTILSHNPYAEVLTRHERWGFTDDQEVADSVSSADIIVCAVGHSPTERYIGRVAKTLQKPVVYAYSSMGAWSGRAFRVIPDKTGCFDCHQHEIINESLPKLTEPETTTEIYDHGCAIPSFPGSGIDTGAVSNIAARLVIQTLLADDPEAYEPTDVDHIVWYSSNVKRVPEVHKVLFCHSAVSSMKEEIARYSIFETGGIFIGYKNEGCIVVTHATGAGPKAKHSLFNFERDVEFCNAELERHYYSTHGVLTYIGEWHTHPLGFLSPSKQDDNEMIGISKSAAYQNNEPILAISKRGIKNPKLLIQCFLYLRNKRTQIAYHVCDNVVIQD